LWMVLDCESIANKVFQEQGQTVSKAATLVCQDKEQSLFYKEKIGKETSKTYQQTYPILLFIPIISMHIMLINI
jgi:hypothetical protein